MAISQAMCTSFKVEVLTAVHNLALSGGDTFKMALYTSAATLDASTTVYTTSNEVTGAGYTAGGKILVNVNPTSSGTTAIAEFEDPTWTTATITARGALIYNSSKSNKAVAVIDFGSDKTSTGGDFTVQMPAFTAGAALLRFV